jgi:hypothetical protein
MRSTQSRQSSLARPRVAAGAAAAQPQRGKRRQARLAGCAGAAAATDAACLPLGCCGGGVACLHPPRRKGEGRTEATRGERGGLADSTAAERKGKGSDAAEQAKQSRTGTTRRAHGRQQ